MIKSEELMVIKRPNTNDIENEKLIKRETRNYSKINHPFILKFYGTTKNNNYIVIEFICGQNLTYIKFNEEEKLTIILQLLSVFKYLHENHFIYHYLKPNNIMIDRNKTAILIDFDRLIVENEKESNDPKTADFMHNYFAPETNVTTKSDIYSLGKIISKKI